MMRKMKTLENMSKDERSLLLFLETRAVDYGGRVDTRHMNEDDWKLAEKWNKNKFIRFGRIVIRHHNTDGTHWCLLSKKAWELAYKERKSRWERLWLKRSWLTTEDNMDANGHPHLNGLNREFVMGVIDEGGRHSSQA